MNTATLGRHLLELQRESNELGVYLYLADDPAQLRTQVQALADRQSWLAWQMTLRLEIEERRN